MIAYTHGGDSWTLTGKIHDFSTNLNPLGMPPSVALAASEGARTASVYPDPLCRELVAKLAEAEAVEPQWVVCGNGAADLIFRLAVGLKPKTALVTAPTFSEYAQALALQDCEIRHHLLTPDTNFAVTEAILQDITADLDVLFLCTPNNPTGALIGGDLMAKILDKSVQNQVTVVVDECFLELSTGGVGLVPYLKWYSNLFLLRAFTKSYAMAGLRLGYGLCANQELLDKVAQSGQPWSVSTPAQSAGLAAVKCTDWVKRTREVLEEERPRFVAALEKLGLRVFPSQANYVLFQALGHTDLKGRLLEHGVLIRSCNNYHGLASDYYRVCIKTNIENQYLLSALQEVLR